MLCALTPLPNRNMVGVSNYLRGQEDAVLHGIEGDIYALQACCRLLARSIVRRDRLLPLSAIPCSLRNRIQPLVFSEICGRLADCVGWDVPQLAPIEDVMKSNPAEERSRRVELYRKQWEAIEDRYGSGSDSRFNANPRARKVQAVKEGVVVAEYPSARSAATELSILLGRTIRRSDIRIAIVRKLRCADVHWQYGEGETVLISNGRGRAIRRRGEGLVMFPSLSAASRELKIPAKQIARRLGDEDFPFEYADTDCTVERGRPEAITRDASDGQRRLEHFGQYLLGFNCEAEELELAGAAA